MIVLNLEPEHMLYFRSACCNRSPGFFLRIFRQLRDKLSFQRRIFLLIAIPGSFFTVSVPQKPLPFFQNRQKIYMAIFEIFEKFYVEGQYFENQSSYQLEIFPSEGLIMPV